MKAIFSTLRDAPRLGRKPVCFGALAVLLLVAAGCSSKKSNAVPEVRNDGGRHAESTMKTAASSSTMQAVSSTGSAVAAPTSGEGAQAMQPGSATGDAKHDWALQYERTVNGPEADLVVRTGDISNLGFGWPPAFDPFSGDSTPVHPWPDPQHIPAGAPDGTDRIMIGSVATPGTGDGYSGALGDCQMLTQMLSSGPKPSTATVNQLTARCKRMRDLTMPRPIVLTVGALPAKINAVLIQMFADDFQPMPLRSHFQVSLNGTRIPNIENGVNALDQSGPIGKLVTFNLLPEYWPLLQSGTLKLMIDDPNTRVADGFAIDFVRLLVNPRNFKYQVSLDAVVFDADGHKPIQGATVTAALASATTDSSGKCRLDGLPAGLVLATAAAPGYDENSASADLVAGKNGSTEILLHRHQEGAADLERAIEQTGSATVYGIHFDTDSAKLRPDSMPALNAVLGLIAKHAGSNWSIAGHTDNQGDSAHNQTLSEQRAASVISWLKDHGVDGAHLRPQGFGASRPLADNSTPNGRALNRRVEVALADASATSSQERQ